MAKPFEKVREKRLVNMGIRVTEETRDELVAEALEEKRSLSDYCRLILESRHDKEETKSRLNE